MGAILGIVAEACASGGPATPSLADAGCDPSRGVPTGISTEQLRSGDHDRTYLLSIPPRYDGTEATPLILELHGFGGSASAQDSVSGLSDVAADAGMIVATPNALGHPPRWFVPFPKDPVTYGHGDARFLSDLLNELVSRLCVDERRVYVTGFSQGGAVTSWLPCDLSGRFAAIAPVESTFFPGRCREADPVSVIAFHGTADETVPYDGGRHFGETVVPPVEEAVRQSAVHAGCSAAPRSEAIGADRLIVFPGCPAGVDVELYAIDGGTHAWPDTATIDATELIVRFFEIHLRSTAQVRP